MPSSLQGKGMTCGGSTPLPSRSRRQGRRLPEEDSPVHFLVLSALDLARLNRTFDTATDSGLFHTLSDEDRQVFVDNLAGVLSPAGKYFMLCFSELEPGGYGPRRVTQREIQDSLPGRVVHQLHQAGGL